MDLDPTIKALFEAVAATIASKNVAELEEIRRISFVIASNSEFPPELRDNAAIAVKSIDAQLQFMAAHPEYV